jgi:hypothetical protein
VVIFLLLLVGNIPISYCLIAVFAGEILVHEAGFPRIERVNVYPKNDIIDGANDVQSNVNRWNVGGVPQFLGKPTRFILLFLMLDSFTPNVKNSATHVLKSKKRKRQYS